MLLQTNTRRLAFAGTAPAGAELAVEAVGVVLPDAASRQMTSNESKRCPAFMRTAFGRDLVVALFQGEAERASPRVEGASVGCCGVPRRRDELEGVPAAVVDCGDNVDVV